MCNSSVNTENPCVNAELKLMEKEIRPTEKVQIYIYIIHRLSCTINLTLTDPLKIIFPIIRTTSYNLKQYTMTSAIRFIRLLNTRLIC